MYTWNQLGINEISNLYLYGNVSKPADLRSEVLIREATKIDIEVDAVTFMNGGPGRFANASQIKLVQSFMNGVFGFPDVPGKRQEFTLSQAVARLGAKTENLSILQSSYQDSSDDLFMRAYIYQSSGFTLAKDAKFIVEADGTRRIENFAILPFNDNFDFESDSLTSATANAYLKPRIDPTKIGRKVVINFDASSKNAIPRTTYTLANFQADALSHQQVFSPAGNARVAAALPAYVENLWVAGVTKLLDANGRAVAHGTTKADTLDASSLIKLASYTPFKEAMTQNGIAYIGGKGADTIQAGATNDYLDGGADNDILQGGVGNDTYVFKSGDGKDRIIDSDGLGSIVLNGVAQLGAAKAQYQLTGGIATWEHSGGTVKYQLNEAQKLLTITGTALGAGEIVVQNVDITALTTGAGYLGIKLERDTKSAVVKVSQANPFATLGGAASGFSQTIGERTAAAFSWFGNAVASAGDYITVAVRGGDGSNVSVVTGAETLNLASAQRIDLSAGQFSRGFAIVSDTEIEGDQNLDFVITYHHEGQAYESNLVSLTLKDAGEPTKIILGDQRAPVAIDEDSGKEYYKWSDTGDYDAEGLLIGGQAQADFEDVINGTQGKDKIEGKGGNDYLSGGVGNDALEGGAGSDVNYYIFSSKLLNIHVGKVP